MHNTSQLFLLLLNVYFNLGMISPYFNQNELVKLSNVTSEIFGLTLPVDKSPEENVDNLMLDYVNALLDIKKINDEQKALEAMQNARRSFIQRAKQLEPQLQVWTNGLSREKSLEFKEKLMMKPYFNSINDIVLSYKLSGKFDNNPQLRQTLESMGGFLPILYK